MLLLCVFVNKRMRDLVQGIVSSSHRNAKRRLIVGLSIMKFFKTDEDLQTAHYTLNQLLLP